MKIAVEIEALKSNPKSVVFERSRRLGQSPENSMARVLELNKDFGLAEGSTRFNELQVKISHGLGHSLWIICLLQYPA